jgi:alpha-tubulin suppressor-like RCC1 family protein
MHVASGYTANGHTCGVTVDGRVVCWGENQFGQTIEPSGPFQQVAAGGLHTCGLRSNGTVTCWGNQVR